MLCQVRWWIQRLKQLHKHYQYRSTVTCCCFWHTCCINCRQKYFLYITLEVHIPRRFACNGDWWPSVNCGEILSPVPSLWTARSCNKSSCNWRCCCCCCCATSICWSFCNICITTNSNQTLKTPQIPQAAVKYFYTVCTSHPDTSTFWSIRHTAVLILQNVDQCQQFMKKIATEYLT